MLTYNSFKKNILNIENFIKQNNYKKAKQETLKLKIEILEYFKKIYKILNYIDNHKINKEIYELIFKNISEFALDLDNFFMYDKNKIQLIFEKLSLSKDKKFIKEISDLFFDILNFLEKKYENKNLPAPSIFEIKNKIKKLTI